MIRKDHRIIFTALGFLAVILREDVPQDKQAMRATSIARLIESFCITSVPDVFAGEYMPYTTSPSDIERLVEDYVAELHTNGSAPLTHDRATLFKMYELLTIQKLRHDQEAFYMLAHDDVIAGSVMRLAEEQIQWGE